MTMKLTIKNEDFARTAIVTVEDFAIASPTPTRTDDHELPPGQTQEIYIHASRRVTITERV